MTKWLELIPDNFGTGWFARLLTALEIEHGWLAEELRVELAMARGELKIEEYIEREAGLLVRREFSESKRLSEGEKHAIQELVAKRTQYAKQVWKSLHEDTCKRLRSKEDDNKNNERFISELIQKMQSFICIHDEADGIDDDGIKLTARSAKTNQLSRLEQLTSELIQIASRSLLKNEKAVSEKQQTLVELRVLNKNANLQTEVKKILNKMQADLNEKSESLGNRNTVIEQLKKEIQASKATASEEMDKHNKTIATMGDHLEKSHSKISDLHNELTEMKTNLSATQYALKKCSAKAAMLEKNRRMGYKHSWIYRPT